MEKVLRKVADQIIILNPACTVLNPFPASILNVATYHIYILDHIVPPISRIIIVTSVCRHVWPQLFFSVSFLYKIIDLPVGQIKTPRCENTFLFRSSQELTCLPLEHLKGFKLTKRPFRALDLLLVTGLHS